MVAYHLKLYQIVLYAEVEDDEKPSPSDSYHTVGFSYGHADDSADQKNTVGGMESAGYVPPFPVPENIVQSLVSILS